MTLDQEYSDDFYNRLLRLRTAALTHEEDDNRMKTISNEFIVYTGPMFSNKTTSLLSTLERYKYQHRKIVTFKPKIDDRYGTADIVTHSGWKTPATCVSSGGDIIEHIESLKERPDVVALDEAFMVPSAAMALILLFRSGFTVVVSSLDMSSTAKPFAEVEKMLPWATQVVKCTAVCVQCGKDARYTHKKVTNDDEIQVGGADLYEPRCAEHHPLVLIGA